MTDDLLPGWPRRGVHRFLGPAVPIAAELRRGGWSVAVLPPATTDDELWDGLVEALGLPAWFGRNLDALDEALRDLARSTALVLSVWSTYARARPDRWSRLLAVLTDRVDEEPPLLVVLAD